MPLSEIHKKRLKKNLVILLMILGFCALIWITTMVRMANAQEAPKAMGPPQKAISTDTGQDTAYTERPGDVEKMFLDQRQSHLDSMQTEKKGYLARGERHLDSIDHRPRGWWNSWLANSDY